MNGKPLKTIEELREAGARPARLVPVGTGRSRGYRLFIGDEEFPFPIESDSVSVRPTGMRYNRLTLTLFVGEVTVETRKRQEGR
ncbi:hypothetical protein [Mycobacterium phage HC]|uniref:Uncharacterized protein n=1 Tax=Mycobacterium phage HC TaxID=2077135 RepID=A0A2Z5XVS1_9CAUD|nr:hypothetical protein KNT11_gp74 [Mycobacterium phage HC]BBC53948.1 hypothetical protein [Mycobacterium phage HC]